MNERREKFTPGSWTVDAAEDAFGNLTIRLADGTEHGDTEADPIAMIYDYANARLIAAAPDLLEALEALAIEAHELRERLNMEYINAGLDEWTDDDTPALVKARVALARARRTDK